MATTVGTGLFRNMMDAWEISQSEMALIEYSLGSAVLDKMRGHGGTLTGAYKAKGGNNERTLAILTSVDSVWKDFDMAPAAKVLSSQVNASNFADAFTAWNIPSQELALIERTIGHAYLREMQGQDSSLVSTYGKLGGSNAQSQRAFQALNDLWDKVDVGSILTSIDSAKL